MKFIINFLDGLIGGIGLYILSVVLLLLYNAYKYDFFIAVILSVLMCIVICTCWIIKSRLPKKEFESEEAIKKYFSSCVAYSKRVTMAMCAFYASLLIAVFFNTFISNRVPAEDFKSEFDKFEELSDSDTEVTEYLWVLRATPVVLYNSLYDMTTTVNDVLDVVTVIQEIKESETEVPKEVTDEMEKTVQEQMNAVEVKAVEAENAKITLLVQLLFYMLLGLLKSKINAILRYHTCLKEFRENGNINVSA